MAPYGELYAIDTLSCSHTLIFFIYGAASVVSQYYSRRFLQISRTSLPSNPESRSDHAGAGANRGSVQFRKAPPAAFVIRYVDRQLPFPPVA